MCSSTICENVGACQASRFCLRPLPVNIMRHRIVSGLVLNLHSHRWHLHLSPSNFRQIPQEFGHVTLLLQGMNYNLSGLDTIRRVLARSHLVYSLHLARALSRWESISTGVHSALPCFSSDTSLLIRKVNHSKAPKLVQLDSIIRATPTPRTASRMRVAKTAAFHA